MTSAAMTKIQPEATDETLAGAACRGDRAAYSALVARYREVAFAYAYARVRDREEAEDIAQEAFVRAYMSLDRFQATASWGAWLMRILRNLCNDALRRRRARPAEPLREDWLEGSPTPETVALTQERAEALRCAVDSLPEKYRIPLLMHYASRRTYREIAMALDLSESTVVGRIAGALRLLRRKIRAEVWQ